MKILSFIGLCATLGMFSCQNNEIGANDPILGLEKGKYYKFSFESPDVEEEPLQQSILSSPSTRLQYDPSYLNLKWHPGDSIDLVDVSHDAVYSGSWNPKNKFKATGQGVNNTKSFAGSMPVYVENGATEAKFDLFGIHPSQSDMFELKAGNDKKGAVFTIVYRQEQNYFIRDKQNGQIDYNDQKRQFGANIPLTSSVLKGHKVTVATDGTLKSQKSAKLIFKPAVGIMSLVIHKDSLSKSNYKDIVFDEVKSTLRLDKPNGNSDDNKFINKIQYYVDSGKYYPKVYPHTDDSYVSSVSKYATETSLQELMREINPKLKDNLNFPLFIPISTPVTGFSVTMVFSKGGKVQFELVKDIRIDRKFSFVAGIKHRSMMPSVSNSI